MEYALLPEQAVSINMQTGEITLVRPAIYTGNNNLNRLEDISVTSNSLRLVVELSDNETQRLFAFLKRCHFKNWETESKDAAKLWESDPHRSYSTGGRRWTLYYWGEEITVSLSGGLHSEPKEIDSFLRYLWQYNPFRTANEH